MPIEDDLRDALHRAARSADPVSDGRVHVQDGPPPSSDRRARVAALVVAAVVGLGAIALAVAAFDEPVGDLPRSGPSPSSVASLDQWNYPDLRGEALADAIGLELQPFGGCAYFVEIDDAVGYCIEGLGIDELDRMALGAKLQGTYDDPDGEVFRSYADRGAWVQHEFPFDDDDLGSIRTPPGWTVRGFGHGSIFDVDEQPIATVRSPDGHEAQSCLPVMRTDPEGGDGEVGLGDVAIAIRWWSGGGWGGASPPPMIDRPEHLEVGDARIDELIRCGDSAARHLSFVLWDGQRRLLIDIVTGSRTLAIGDLAIVDTLELR